MVYPIIVKPGSKKGPLVEQDKNNELVVFVRERAINNQANIAVVAILSDYFNVPKTAIRIVRGGNSRLKFIRIDD